MARLRGRPTRTKPGIDKHWHLATDALEVGVTELEFSIFRTAAAFERWQADCLGCCVAQSFSGTETAMLHVVRMHDRPKSISEICRLLKRDDVANIQYGIRKLLKAGLISKADHAGSKRDVTYVVSAAGRSATDRYAAFRRELLISMARTAAAGVDFEAIARTLNMMAALYDQASSVAATHRVAS